MTGSESSGDIRQTGTVGTAIAHTGTGNINVRVERATFTVETSGALAEREGMSSPVIVRRTLPRDITAFTGRDSEFRTLLEAVKEGTETGRLVVIHAIDGMAGIGKTALAVHAAHQLAPHFQDGQLFVRMHAHTPGQRPIDPQDALKALLRETGVHPGQIPDSLDEKERLWRDRLAGKRVLLLLDDAASHHQVKPLIPGTDGCAVIVTSRYRLNALEGAVPLPLDIMPPGQAARLFGHLSGRGDAEPEAVAELVRLAGYLPLAIRLLASRLRHNQSWTVARLAAELGAARNRSAAIGATDESVSAAFDLSYNRLPNRRRRFFRYLGLHPGTDIDTYSAAALTGLGLDRARAELDALFSDHLIDEPSQGRYRFHDLLGDYARALARVNAPPDHEAATKRLLSYYLHAAQAADRHLARHAHDLLIPVRPLPAAVPDLLSREEAAAWMSAERSNLHAAVDHAAAHSWASYATGIPAAMNGFLHSHGHWQEALTLHSTALEAAQRIGDTPAEARALLDLGTVQYQTGNFPAAGATLLRALEHYESLGDRLGQANALHDLGYVQRLAGDARVAAASLTQAIVLYRALGNLDGEARAINDLGYAQCMMDDFTAATASFTQALHMYRTASNQNGEANALNYLGVVQYQTGNYQAAIASQRQALILYKTLGNQNGQANALNYLGHVQYETGEIKSAAISVAQALELYRQIGNRLGEANALRYLSRIQQATGESSAAVANASQALELHRSLGDRLGEANALNVLGSAQYGAADYRAARASLTRALEQFQDIGEQIGQAEALNNLGELQLASGATLEAQGHHEQALTVTRAITAPTEEARALEGIAQCHFRNHRPHEASILLQQALAIYRRLGSARAQHIEALLQHYNL